MKYMVYLGFTSAELGVIGFYCTLTDYMEFYFTLLHLDGKTTFIRGVL